MHGAVRVGRRHRRPVAGWLCRGQQHGVDADPQTRALGEVNAGVYCFDAGWLRANIGSVPASPSGEHYLTDLVAIAASAGGQAVVVSAPLFKVVPVPMALALTSSGWVVLMPLNSRIRISG